MKNKPYYMWNDDQSKLVDTNAKDFKAEDTKPSKKSVLDGLTEEWINHNIALYSDGDPKDIIEDVRTEENAEIRGALTGKLYNAKEAIEMNEKYDRNFTNPDLMNDKQNYLTANEKILATYNPRQMMTFTKGGKDKENVALARFVKAKARRIENLEKAKTAKPAKKDEKLFENIIDNLGKDKNKTALLTDEQKKDPKIIEMPLPDFGKEIEKMEKEKEIPVEDSYRFTLPKQDNRFAELTLKNDLAKAEEATSGIGAFDNRSQKLLANIEEMIRRLNAKT